MEGKPWHTQVSGVESIYFQQANLRSFKGNGKVILSHLKEILKQDIKVYYRIFMSALFREIL